MSIEHLLLIYNLSKMAKYDELVASADGYDSDDSGADTDEEVITRWDLIGLVCDSHDEKQHLNTLVDLDKA